MSNIKFCHILCCAYNGRCSVEIMNGDDDGSRSLCYAAGVYLIMIGSLDMFSKDPEKSPKC
jgi:hypothetical protein